MLRKALPAAVAAVALAGPVRAETVDEVVARALQARGGRSKLEAVQSLRMTGRMKAGDEMDAAVVIEKKRPRRSRLEITVGGQTAVQAYDGQQAWGVPPGARAPQPLPAEMARDIDREGDLDGPLVDYGAKGHRVELVGREDVEGKPAWKLKVTLKQGELRHVYLDASSFLEVMSVARRDGPGGVIEVENRYSDYRESGGVMWPYRIQVGAKGRPQQQVIRFEAVEVNPALDDARFRMPRS